MDSVNCKRCNYIHPDNGNCTAVGGFCTAVPASYCKKLAEYMDTGLEPEKIAFLKYLVDDAFSDKPDFTERLRELAKADREGRLAEIPCNVGDVWYEVDTPAHGVITHTCTSVSSGYLANDGLCGRPKDDGQTPFFIVLTKAVSEDGCSWPDSWNKDDWEDRYLTREEAEAALKGGK